MGKKHGRSHGEGSIFPRTLGGKPAGWMGMIDLGVVKGKRRRRAFYGTTQKQVRDKVMEARNALKKGTMATAGRLTTAEWLQDWLDNVVGPEASEAVRPSTYRTYELLVRVHLIPALGAIPLERLSSSDVRGMLSSKRTTLSPQSVRHLRAVLRNALERAVEHTPPLIPRNPAVWRDRRRSSGSPTATAAATRELTQDQASIFLGAVRGDRLEALYVTALGLGLRQGEVLGLRWQDVDLEGGRRLSVRHALQRIRGRYQLVEPKSETSKRTVELPEFVLDALREHRTRQDAERQALGENRWLNQLGLIFTTPFGAPLHGTAVTHTFHGVLERAGLPRIRFHDLRHSCASLLLAQGVPPRMIMELLGHSQISLTMNRYSHVLPSVRKEAAAAMDQVFSGK